MPSLIISRILVGDFLKKFLLQIPPWMPTVSFPRFLYGFLMVIFPGISQKTPEGIITKSSGWFPQRTLARFPEGSPDGFPHGTPGRFSEATSERFPKITLENFHKKHLVCYQKELLKDFRFFLYAYRRYIWRIYKESSLEAFQRFSKVDDCQKELLLSF